MKGSKIFQVRWKYICKTTGDHSATFGVEWHPTEKMGSSLGAVTS